MPVTMDKAWEKRGQFGDMFGAVNSLFSGLAFFGIIITLFLQRKDLQVQQELLKETIREQKAASEALEMQVEIMRDSALLNALASGIADATQLMNSNIGGLKIKGKERQRALEPKFLEILKKYMDDDIK